MIIVGDCSFGSSFSKGYMAWFIKAIKAYWLLLNSLDWF